MMYTRPGRLCPTAAHEKYTFSSCPIAKVKAQCKCVTLTRC